MWFITIFCFCLVPSPKRLRLNPVPAVVFLEAAGSDTSTSCPRVPRSGPGPSHPQEPSSRVPAPPLGSGGGPLVHYFWGVPFCPQGLDPDRYTQVGRPLGFLMTYPGPSRYILF